MNNKKNIKKAVKISKQVFDSMGELNKKEMEELILKHKSNDQWIKDHVDIVARAIAHHSQKYEVLKMRGLTWSYKVFGNNPQEITCSYTHEGITHIYVLSLYENI